jgi:hypothetical protein
VDVKILTGSIGAREATVEVNHTDISHYCQNSLLNVIQELGSRSEPEAAQTPFRDVPMR